MKKYLFILFAIAMVNLPAFSVVNTDEAISDTYIRNHGYSGEMSRLIDLQNSQINGISPKFKGTDPTWDTSNKYVNFIRKTFIYMDPGLDDEKFMQHDIKYTTRYDSL